MAATSYQVRIGGRQLRIQVRHDADGIFVRVGDSAEEQAAVLAEVHGALYTLKLGDRVVELLASVGQDEVRLNVGGQEYVAEVVDEAHARLAAVAGSRVSAHARRELKAPMPGLLVNVLCQPGDTIQAGQPLVVLQAMKMENELSLPYAGTVKAVRAQPGQTVEQGQVLVVIE